MNAFELAFSLPVALAAIAVLAGLTFTELLPYIETNRDRLQRQEEID
ncbi:hypothetical protein K3725_08840 [Leisingera sp. S132]|nr:hypothetical protein [Leisingera sp. S132]UWQ81083.1 hypothetical protein K3725_08840 [Leisingera sp. S132]